MNLENAIKLAVNAHYGQVDKAGQPYILHPLRVMLTLDSEKEKIVGVLHDVVEDTEITLEYLSEFKFNDEILDAINSVTKSKNESYDEFILRAAQNPIGKRVKLADLKDNMNMERILNPTEKDYERLNKYKKAVEILESI